MIRPSRPLALACLMVLVPLAGCSKPENPEALVDEMVNEYAKIPGIIASVTDEASAKRAAADLDALQVRFQALADRTRKLPDPPKAEQDRLDERRVKAIAKTNEEIDKKSAELLARNPAAAKTVGEAVDRLCRAIVAMRPK